MRSEGWQYIELTGTISGFFAPHELPSHKNQFKYFCHVIEKIKMKQVEEEYYKLSETQEATKHPQNQTQATDALLPMSPLKPVGELSKTMSPELMKQLIEAGFKSSNTVENGSSNPIEETAVSVFTDLSGNTSKQ